MIKISIVTINLNNSLGLLETVNSVLGQTFQDYEFIIIDGGSTDGSVEIIDKYKDKITNWISEKDTGIYEAMNKGIKLSNGEFLLMLNSGDVLTDKNVLSQVVLSGMDSDIVFGDIHEIVDDNNSYFTKFPDRLSFSYFYHYSLGHQAIFVRRKLHDRIGLYNEKNRIISDWCFFTLAICRYGCSYRHVPVTVASCKRNGVSCDPENLTEILEGRRQFLEKEFPLFYNDYVEGDRISEELNRTKVLLSKEINGRFWRKVKKWLRKVIITFGN